MIKTIKVKKQLRLDELIKYAFDNELEEVIFKSDKGGAVAFDMFGRFEALDHVIISPNSTFRVEIEMNITPDTRFEKLVVIYRTYNDGKVKYGVRNNKAIQQMLDGHENSDVLKIYALIDENLELIWECNEE